MAGGREIDRGEVGDAVRGDVAPRVAHLVHKLLGDRGDRHHAARAGMLGDDEAAVRRCLGDREARIGQTLHRTPVLEEVAAGGLGTTLDDVSRHRAGGHLVPIIRGPAEFVEDGTQREPGVGDPAGNHDVSPEAQRLHDRGHPEIGVGRQHLVANLPKRPPGFHVA